MPLKKAVTAFDIMDGPFQGLRPAAYMLKLHAHEHRNCLKIGFGAHGYEGTPIHNLSVCGRPDFIKRFVTGCSIYRS